jgi:hypothetical protein
MPEDATSGPRGSPPRGARAARARRRRSLREARRVGHVDEDAAVSAFRVRDLGLDAERGAARVAQRDERAERRERVLHREHGDRRQDAGPERVGHRGHGVRDEHVPELAQRGLLRVVHQSARRREERPHDRLARGAREEEREDAAEPALDVEEDAAHRRALVVADRPHEPARERFRAEEAHGRHAHPARPADDARERVGGVTGADARELAHAVEIRFVDGDGVVHASWFRSSTKIGRPSPRTVMPERARADARSAGTGFT